MGFPQEPRREPFRGFSTPKSWGWVPAEGACLWQVCAGFCPCGACPPPSPLPGGGGWPLGSRRVAGGLRSCTVACCQQDSEKACEEVTFLSGFPPPGVRPVLKSRSGQRGAREGRWAPQMREAGACSSLHFGTRQMFSEFSLNMALFSYLLLGQVCEGMKSKIAFGAG